MRNAVIFTSAILTAVLAGCGPSRRLPVNEQRAAIDQMAERTVEELYAQRPAAREEIENAAGVGVFSNAAGAYILVTAGGGYGVIHDNLSGRKTYMRMGMGGLGLGLGAKDYRQVLVFLDRTTMDRFTGTGWDFGGQASAAAKAGETGGEVSGHESIRHNIITYTFTESGLIAQAALTGTRYWPDRELNLGLE